jgi:hypothetical protein
MGGSSTRLINVPIMIHLQRHRVEKAESLFADILKLFSTASAKRRHPPSKNPGTRPGFCMHPLAERLGRRYILPLPSQPSEQAAPGQGQEVRRQRSGPETPSLEPDLQTFDATLLVTPAVPSKSAAKKFWRPRRTY